MKTWSALLSTLGFAFFRDHANTRIDLLMADTTFDESAIGRGVELELAARSRVRVCIAEDLVAGDRPRRRSGSVDLTP